MMQLQFMHLKMDIPLEKDMPTTTSTKNQYPSEEWFPNREITGNQYEN